MSFMTAITSPDPIAFSLAASILLITYLTIRCLTPPNPNPTKPKEIDSLGHFTGPFFLFARRAIIAAMSIYHAFLCLTYPSPPSAICPRSENLSSQFFTWNSLTITCILLISTAATMRLMCFAQLGPNFTFRLATPKKLVTTGLYSWIQHPSYTTNIIVIFTNGVLFWRRGGVVACWLPPWVVESDRVGMASSIVSYAMVLVTGYALSMRVRDEESMLKERFGKEWEVYHAKTKRFIPYVF